MKKCPHTLGSHTPPIHIDQLSEGKGHADYFLLASDAIAWCHSDYTIQDWMTLQAPWPAPDAGRTLSRGGPRSPSRDTADHEE